MTDSVKKIPLASEQDLEAEFSIEIDETGFSINCNIVAAKEHFNERIVPAILLTYVRTMCKEFGLDFGKVLKSSLGVFDHESIIQHKGPMGEA